MSVSCIKYAYFCEQVRASHVFPFHRDTIKSWTLYTKEDKQFLRDKDLIYHYGPNTFRLENGYFILDKLKIKLPERTEIATIERVILSLGFTIGTKDLAPEIDLERISFREVLNALTALALKDLSIIHGNFTQAKQAKYGEVVFGAYLAAVSGSGSISAKQKDIRWLNEQDTLKLKSKLFDNLEMKYKVGVYSMKYIPTLYAKKTPAKQSLFDNHDNLRGADEYK